MNLKVYRKFAIIFTLLFIVSFSYCQDSSPLNNLLSGIIVKHDGTSIPNGGDYDAGFIQVGQTRNIIFTIENNGSKDLNLYSNPKVVISGDDCFSISNQPPVSIVLPKENTSFTIEISPMSAGEKSATVSIDNNYEDNNPYTLTILCTGTAPEILVKQGSNEIFDNGSFDIGFTPVGQPLEIEFTITNLGNLNLNLLGGSPVGISGLDSILFNVTSQPIDTTILPNESTSFFIEFYPTNGGDKSALVDVSYNGTFDSNYQFEIYGSSMGPDMHLRQGIDDISSGDNFDFGTSMATVFGSPENKYMEFIIENLGDSDLNLTGSTLVEISGDTDNYIVTVQPSKTVIVPGDTTTFTIQFIPDSIVGNKIANVNISSNDAFENPYSFIISSTVWSPKISDTGQTKCYDSSGNIITCVNGGTWPRQDGYFINTPNARSFTDNGYGTVTDNTTSLIWTKCNLTEVDSTPVIDDTCGDNNGEGSWNNAITACENLEFAGRSDWRLPDYYELTTLLNYGGSHDTGFPSMNSYYWSSSEYNSTSSYRVSFPGGIVVGGEKSLNHFVRCVTGPRNFFTNNNRITNNGDGTVTDNGTGLVWQLSDNGPGEQLTWGSSLNYCSDLTLAGRNWRLPSINELRSTVDLTKDSNSTLRVFSNEYWSSTSYHQDPRYAWSIHYGFASINFIELSPTNPPRRKYKEKFVRCVSDGP